MQAGMEAARMKQQLLLEAAAKLKADEVGYPGGISTIYYYKN